MSKMLTRVAAAIEQAFKDRVAASASTPGKPMTFEATGVTTPGFDVWEAYAHAAVEAIRAYDNELYRLLDAGIVIN